VSAVRPSARPVQFLIGIGVVAAVLAVTWWLGLLASGTLDEEDGTSPAPAPAPTSARWWEDGNHPPRAARVEVRVAAKGEVAQVDAEYSFTLQPKDPLIDIVQRGEATCAELRWWLLGETTSGESDRPVLHRRGGEPAQVRCAREFTIGSGPSRFGEVWQHRGADAVFGDKAQISAAARSLVSARNLRISTDGLRIVAIQGPGVSAQNETTATLDGPPAVVLVSFLEAGRGPAAGGTENDAEAGSPFTALAIDRTTGRLLYGAVLLAPWIFLILAVRQWEARRPGTRAMRLIALLVTSVGLVAVAVELPTPSILPALDGPLLIMAPLLVAVGVRRARGLSWRSRGVSARLTVAGLVTAAVTYGAAWLEPGVRHLWSTSEILLPVSVACCAGLLAGLPVVLRSPFVARDLLAAGSVAAAVGAFLYAYSALADDDLDDTAPVYLAVAFTIGLACAYVAEAGLVEPRMPGYTAGRQTALYSVGALLFLSAFGGSYPDFPLVLRMGGFTAALMLLGITLVGVTVALLSRRGLQPEAMADPVVRGLVLSCLLVIAPERGNLLQFNALSVALLVLCWSLTVPRRHAAYAVTKTAVTAAGHVRLVRAELRRRLMEKSAHDVYRQARRKLRDGEVDIRAYDVAQQQIDEAATPLRKQVAGVAVRDALATAAGHCPRDNAIAAAMYAAPIAVLILGYEIWALAVSKPQDLVAVSLLELAFLLLHQLRWVGYAAVYGYFYPLIRGRGPVGKALSLVVLTLPVEVLSVLASIDPEPVDSILLDITTVREMALALAIRAGQVVLFCVTLGLAWETRLIRLAGYPWDRLRNVRSIRSLATPAGAVAVAVATALGTAVASTAVAALLSTPPSPSPAPAPSSAPSGRTP